LCVAADKRGLDGRAMKGLRIGLLGGSFNPAHEGHRHISLLALQRLRLDAVWWLVSPQNPLKPEIGMATFENRFEMAKQVARHPRIKVSDFERKLGTRYTVDTLRMLSRRRRQDRFVWIIGADNLMQMPRWHRWTALFEMVPVAVLARPTYSPRSLSGAAAHRFRRNRLPDRMAGLLVDQKPPAWVFLHTPLHNASATQIRSE
jgi:nicotinate-nucleotide adenylyltransferase